MTGKEKKQTLIFYHLENKVITTLHLKHLV